MNTFFIHPARTAEGKPKRVPDPESADPRAVLPAGGAEKPRTAYWLRRVRDGDAIEGKPEPSAVPATAPPPKPATASTPKPIAD